MDDQMTLTKPILDAAVALFGIKDTQLESLRGGHFSHVYEFSHGSKTFVLRITPPSPEINLEELHAILEWMRYLAEHGACVPSPITSRDNNFIEIIEHDNGTYLAMVLEAADGILSEEMQLEQWNDELYKTLGSTLGKIHTLASQYNRSHSTRIRPTWDGVPNNFNPNSDQNPDLEITYANREKILYYLNSLAQDKDNFGLMHGDLHLGNFFIDITGNKITIFDFDDCVYGWFMMDIATLVFDFPVVYPDTDDNEQTNNFIRHLIHGYISEKPTSGFWLRQLPYFLKLLEIGIYVLVYKDYNPQDNESWIGKFMQGRKARIESETPYLNIDFEEMFRFT